MVDFLNIFESVTLTPKDSFEDRDSFDIHWNGERVGYVNVGTEYPPREAEIPRIIDIKIFDEYRGNGLGRQAIKQLFAKYGKLTSDRSGHTTPAAEKMWQDVGGRKPVPEDNVHPDVKFIYSDEPDEMPDVPAKTLQQNKDFAKQLFKQNDRRSFLKLIGLAAAAIPMASAGGDPTSHKERLEAALEPYNQLLKDLGVETFLSDDRLSNTTGYWDAFNAEIGFDTPQVNRVAEAVGPQVYALVAYHEVHHAVLGRVCQEMYGADYLQKLANLWQDMCHDIGKFTYKKDGEQVSLSYGEITQALIAPYKNFQEKITGKEWTGDNKKLAEAARAFGEFLQFGVTSEALISSGKDYEEQAEALKILRVIMAQQRDQLVFSGSVVDRLKQLTSFLKKKMGKIGQRQPDALAKVAQLASSINDVMNAGSLEGMKSKPMQWRHDYGLPPRDRYGGRGPRTESRDFLQLFEARGDDELRYLYEYLSMTDEEKLLDMAYNMSYSDNWIDFKNQHGLDDETFFDEISEELKKEFLASIDLEKEANEMIRLDPAMAPAWISMEAISPPRFTNLVHYTDNAYSILRDGFKGFADMQRLALTSYWNDSAYAKGVDEGYAFAFEEGYGDGHKYGSEKVLFEAPAVKVYHWGDDEYQWVFWTSQAKNIRLEDEEEEDW